MNTFHNVAVKIETTKAFKSIMETRKVNNKRYILMRHAEDATNIHHFRLNITTDKSTSLDLRIMGLFFLFFTKQRFLYF